MQTKTDPPEAVHGKPNINKSQSVRALIPAQAEPFVIQRERALLADLFQLVAARAVVEPRIDVDFKKQSDAEVEEFGLERFRKAVVHGHAAHAASRNKDVWPWGPVIHSSNASGASGRLKT